MIEYLDKQILERGDVRLDYTLGCTLLLFIGITATILHPLAGLYILSGFYLVFGGKIFLTWLWGMGLGR